MRVLPSECRETLERVDPEVLRVLDASISQLTSMGSNTVVEQLVALSHVVDRLQEKVHGLSKHGVGEVSERERAKGSSASYVGGGGSASEDANHGTGLGQGGMSRTHIRRVPNKKPAGTKKVRQRSKSGKTR